jgi:hypothetical protein
MVIMKRITIELINAIVEAADRVGGISNLEMPSCRKKILFITMRKQRRRWRDCVGSGHLWFNNRTTHSTGIVKIF